jgi:hypothetical protein
MLIIGFLGYAALTMVEDISRTMTNASAAAAGLAFIPKADPKGIHDKTTGIMATGMVKLGELAVNGIKDRAKNNEGGGGNKTARRAAGLSNEANKRK